MANEITFTASLAATKSGVTVTTGSQSAQATMAGDQMITNVQAVGTDAEALLLGDVSSLGFVFVRNLDATNFVELSLESDGSSPFAKLLAGEFAVFPAATATMYAIADTAGCNVQVVAVER